MHGWLAVCFAAGPVGSLSRTLLPAMIQSSAHRVGRSSTNTSCLPFGNDCFVTFGRWSVHTSSYVLYLRAIYTSLEAVAAVAVMGWADRSHHRKHWLVALIGLHGLLAIPFGIIPSSALVTQSTLYCSINVNIVVHQIIESTYVPMLMHDGTTRSLRRGSWVSAWGMVAGNGGALTALLIGIVIQHTLHTFGLTATIAGSLTVGMCLVCAKTLPNIKKHRSPQTLVPLGAHRNCLLLCLSWVLWNAAFGNFMSVLVLLFRTTLGLGSLDTEYTVFTFVSYLVACVGLVAWMAGYRHTSLSIKAWGVVFLSVGVGANVWGAIGIGSSRFGLRKRWELWAMEVLVAATSSAHRSLLRTWYSALVPRGCESQLFGLEALLSVATGWVGLVVNAVVQDRTGIERMPFVPNAVLVGVALLVFVFVADDAGTSADATRRPATPTEP